MFVNHKKEKYMIPKKIHYVWLGKNKPSPSVIRCIDSWRRVMPTYEMKCWNEDNFDIDSVTWVKEAIEKKKWSLASDYIRHYAVYNEGGIYFDTDVYTYKSLDDFLNYDFFSSIELHPNDFNNHGKHQLDKNCKPLIYGQGIAGLGILAAAFGACKGNVFIKECLDFFGSRHFIKEDGTLFEDFINPAIMAELLIKYGFRYTDEKQELKDNMVVFPSSVLAGDIKTRTKDSHLIHWCDSTWRDPNFFNYKGKIILYLRTHFPSIFRR